MVFISFLPPLLLSFLIPIPFPFPYNVEERLNFVEVFYFNAELRRTIRNHYLRRCPDFARILKRLQRKQAKLEVLSPSFPFSLLLISNPLPPSPSPSPFFLFLLLLLLLRPSPSPSLLRTQTQQDCVKLYNFLRLIPDLLELFQNYSGAHDNLVQIKFLTPLQVSLSLLPLSLLPPFSPPPLPLLSSFLPSFASIFTTLLLLSFYSLLSLSVAFSLLPFPFHLPLFQRKEFSGKLGKTSPPKNILKARVIIM